MSAACVQCGSPNPNTKRKLCSALCLRLFRVFLVRRTIAVHSGKVAQCLFCGHDLENRDRKTCGSDCLKSFRAALARRTLLTVHPCMGCKCSIYGERKTCSDFCKKKVLLEVGAAPRQRYVNRLRIQARNIEKIARDKTLWESRHPVIIR